MRVHRPLQQPIVSGLDDSSGLEGLSVFRPDSVLIRGPTSSHPFFCQNPWTAGSCLGGVSGAFLYLRPADWAHWGDWLGDWEQTGVYKEEKEEEQEEKEEGWGGRGMTDWGRHSVCDNPENVSKLNMLIYLR